MTKDISKWLELFAQLSVKLAMANIRYRSDEGEKYISRFFKAKEEGNMEEAKRIIEEVE